MNLDENETIAKATVENMTGFLFIKWQDKDDN